MKDALGQCSKHVADHTFRGHKCRSSAVMIDGSNGSRYCRTHDPIAAQERRRTSDERHYAKRDAEVKAQEHMRECTKACEGIDPEAVPDLLAACYAYHDAMDTLFAMLIARDMKFFPSKSGEPWDAFVRGDAAIMKAKKGRTWGKGSRRGNRA